MQNDEKNYEDLRNVYLEEGYDEETVELLIEREKTFTEYGAVTRKLNPIQNEKDALLSKIKNLSVKICIKAGHSLSDEAQLTKAYGLVYHCLRCGRMVRDDDIRGKDSFVDKDGNRVKRLNRVRRDDFTKQ